MLQSTLSSLDPNLSPQSWVYRIWFSTFSLRFWMSWIIAHPSKTLEHNLILSNVYLCVESNAHSLVMILIRLKRENKAHLLFSWLFPSNFIGYLSNRKYSGKFYVDGMQRVEVSDLLLSSSGKESVI
jgi:hypothetical protein